jgi:xylose dehydrogenase (NAD/NADP)
MTERVRWGVLGNANIARICVIPAIRKSRNGTMQALASRSPHQAEEVVRKHEIRRVYEDYDVLLADPEIDAVYIPLPNHLHHPWTLKALRAGKHVVCEKPLARSAREAQEMAGAAAEAGLLLMEAFMYRFHPRSQRIKKLVADGSLGEPRLVRSAFCYRMADGPLASGDNPRLKPDMGGGALLDVGCYGVSLARWLFGAEPVQVQAQAVYHPRGVDVHFVGLLRFPDTGLATIEASFISALEQTYTVVGAEGAIELPHDAFIPWDKETLFIQRGRDQERGREHVTAAADEYQLMVEHFADAVLGGRQLSFSPEDSLGNMRVLEALAEAARTGRTISL